MKPTSSLPVSRRNFLKTTGCLTIGFPLLSSCWSATGEVPVQEDLPGSLRAYPKINAWLEVLDDGKVRVLTGKLELGQGIRTAVAQMAAEELYMEMDQVEVVVAETGRTPNEGYTAGSASVENSAIAVRYAAAAAREKLLALAAEKLSANPAQLQLKNGVVMEGNQQLTFAEILEGRQIEDEVRMPVRLKPKKEYRWVGKAVHRPDIETMIRGEQVYVQDLRFPGMVHARVVHPPAYEATLVKFEEEAVKEAVPDVLKVVANGSFLGVIAADEYQAIRAAEALRKQAQWSTPTALPSETSLQEHLQALPVTSEQVEDKGNTAPSDKGTTVKATYFKPYIMHGAIGPSCAVALYDNGKLDIWSHSQGVYPLREAIQKMLGLAIEQIHIKGVPGSGCYGHNGADDAAAEAALLAMAYPGKHVRLQWSREDEHGWEPYGSAMQMAMEAQLDAAGKIQHWRCTLWSDSHSTRPGGDPGNLVTAHYLEKPFPRQSAGYLGGGYRNSQPYYSIPNLRIDAHFFEGPLRVSSLRSLGAYANIFAIESFMDELAEKAGKDPLTFRLDHQEDPRAIAVIRKLQEMTKDQKTADHEGMGYAFSRYKNEDSYCAVAALVAVDTQNGGVRVKNMWAAIDAGEVINLDGIKNQTEGGMIQSASWTLKEEVQFDKQHVSSLDWNSYPMLRFSEVPSVEVAVIARPEEPPVGAGEAAQGPSSAAIANAVYRACGKRVRQLPIKPEKLI